jgi:hypothetical protein
MKKEPKLPDDAESLLARLTNPAGSPKGAPAEETPDQKPKPEGGNTLSSSAAEPRLPAPGVCPPGAADDPRLASPGGWNPYPPGMPEEDEINLLDLFIVLLKHKVMIFSWVVGAIVASER